MVRQIKDWMVISATGDGKAVGTLDHTLPNQIYVKGAILSTIKYIFFHKTNVQQSIWKLMLKECLEDRVFKCLKNHNITTHCDFI